MSFSWIPNVNIGQQAAQNVPTAQQQQLAASQQMQGWAAQAQATNQYNMHAHQGGGTGYITTITSNNTGGITLPAGSVIANGIGGIISPHVLQIWLYTEDEQRLMKAYIEDFRKKGISKLVGK